MGVLSYGQTLFYSGICLAIVGILSACICNTLFSIRRRKIKKELTDKYGF